MYMYMHMSMRNYTVYVCVYMYLYSICICICMYHKINDECHSRGLGRINNGKYYNGMCNHHQAVYIELGYFIIV